MIDVGSEVEAIAEFDAFSFKLDSAVAAEIRVDASVEAVKESKEEIARQIREAVADTLNFNELAEEGIAIRSEARKSLTIKGGAKHSVVPSSWKPGSKREQALNTPPEREEIMKRELKNGTLYYLVDKTTGKIVYGSAFMKRKRSD